MSEIQLRKNVAGTFEVYREEITKDWEILHKDLFLILYSTPIIVAVIM